MSNGNVAGKWIGLFAVCLVATILATLLSLFVSPQAQAIPAFALKYDVNCTVCHADHRLALEHLHDHESDLRLPSTNRDCEDGRSS